LKETEETETACFLLKETEENGKSLFSYERNFPHTGFSKEL